MNSDFSHQLQSVLQEIDDERRSGMIDIVKVILSIAAVMLTIFISLIPDSGIPKFSVSKLGFMAFFLPLISLLVCIGMSLYHLYYAQVQMHTDRVGGMQEAISKSNEPAIIIKEINSAKIDIPPAYRISLKIIASSFMIATVLLCIHPFIQLT